MLITSNKYDWASRYARRHCPFNKITRLFKDGTTFYLGWMQESLCKQVQWFGDIYANNK